MEGQSKLKHTSFAYIYLDQHSLPSVLKILTQHRWSALISLASSQSVNRPCAFHLQEGHSVSASSSAFVPALQGPAQGPVSQAVFSGEPTHLLPQKQRSM